MSWRDPADIGGPTNAVGEADASDSIPKQHGPQRTTASSNISISAHRQSFAENLRNGPSSPRQRHPSFTQAAVQELMNNPPPNKHANPKFAGREWGDIQVGELVTPDDVWWINLDSSVEEATMKLLKSPTSVVLVRESKTSKTAVSVFDFSDLNTYLLIVTGLAKPEGHQFTLAKEMMSLAQRGDKISLRQLQPLCNRAPLVKLDAGNNLASTIEILGSGLHRILITNADEDVIGIMSQLRVLDFFWNEGINFPAIETLYPATLKDLGVGTHQAISINSDAPLSEALILMHDEGLTSVAVVDNGHNVVGNISTKDVRHLTTTSSAPLLRDTCMHFISVILNERGVEMGRDAFPVFYVHPSSTLAHTVAKLVATRSHRMWIVESSSPTTSIPTTPSLVPSVLSTPSPVAATSSSLSSSALLPASAMVGSHLSGKLTGVISLTDILNTFAKSTGLRPTDPGEQRARRRRSSSSSIRPSLESSRASIDIRR